MKSILLYYPQLKHNDIQDYSFVPDKIPVDLEVYLGDYKFDKSTLIKARDVIDDVHKKLNNINYLLCGEFNKLSEDEVCDFFNKGSVKNKDHKRDIHDLDSLFESFDFMCSEYKENNGDISRYIYDFRDLFFVVFDNPDVSFDEAIKNKNKILEAKELSSKSAKVLDKYLDYFKLDFVKRESALLYKSHISSHFGKDTYSNCLKPDDIHNMLKKYLEFDFFKLDDLLKSSLKCKDNFLEIFTLATTDVIYQSMHGISQLLNYDKEICNQFDFARVTDRCLLCTPGWKELSTDLGGYPLIEYSDSVLNQVKIIYDDIVDKLKDFPANFYDIDLSKKNRKSGQIRYSIEELPKDPFDLKIGNDSGCCLAVPSKKELDGNQNTDNNFKYIIDYLNNDVCKFFGLYMHNQKNHEKKKRIGFILSFDGKTESNKKCLVLNSLELSRFYMSGGRPVYDSVVDFVEDWFFEYAKVKEYDRCVMGRFVENRAFLYGTREKENTDESINVDIDSSIYTNVLDGKSVVKKDKCYVIL